MNTSLVTAFYEIPNEHTVTRYIEKAVNFLKIGQPIILFTSPEAAPLFRHFRSECFHIIEKPFNEIKTWKTYGPGWEKKYGSNPLKRLYALRCAKPFFMVEAAERNPFSSKQFLWCNLSVKDLVIPELPTNQIVIGSIRNCGAESYSRHLDGLYGLPSEGRMIDTTVWGGGADAIRAWCSAYEHALILYLESARPLVDDFGVFFAAATTSLSLAFIAEGRVGITTGLRENSKFSCPVPHSPVCIVMLGGLGNQMFQLATAYAYARKYNGKLHVLRDKESYDRRPMYWDSVLSRWSHLLVDALPETPLWHETKATHYTVPPKLTPLGIRLNYYLQSPKYFVCDEIRNEIRAMMRPSDDVLRTIGEKYAALLAMRGRVVVMHARRGDYCNDGGRYHGPLEVEYYTKATDKMSEFVKKPHYLLCSDDAAYWPETIPKIPLLAEADYTILDDDSDVNTLGLLQQFTHFVIANSSFSWWSAWLAEEPKTVIAPDRWFGPAGPALQFYQDIYDVGWIKC